MRDIKFRAWITVEVDDEDNDIKAMTYDLAYSQYLPINDWLSRQSDLMQFTGLKDKNGVDIYEGDIINANYFKNGLVVFWRYGWHFNTGKDCHHSFNTASHSFEVIGNIHENPELLNK